MSPRFRMLLLLLALIAGMPAPAAEGDGYRGFEDPAERSRYQELIGQIRCLVCQGQSIAESNADLAKDLRAQVSGMIREGRTDAEIVDFLVARYGDFILYRPPVRPSTWLLWGGPFLLLALAVTVMLALVRRFRQKGVPAELSEAERNRLEAALHNADDDQRRL